MLGIFLDSETNGLNFFKHHICEIALKIVNLESGESLDTFDTIIKLPRELWEKSDPESLKVNALSWDLIQGGMEPLHASKRIESLFERHQIQRGRSVFICQNPSFDRAFFAQLINADRQEALNWPYHWLDLASMYWTKALLDRSLPPWESGISKNDIAKIMGLPSEEEPHRALNGVEHLLLCYEAVVGYPGRRK